jgi:glycosyltransferase involved in cell wall biosynthesis
VLQGVLRQRHLPDQVVVADDGSGPPTRAVVEAFAPRFAAAGVAFDHAWQPDDGYRLAAVRNLALARATGDYVLQLDGDCVPHPGYVRDHLAFARAGAFVQGSRVMVNADRTTAALAARDPVFRLIDRGLKSRQNALPLAPLRALVPSPQDSMRYTRGCNMAYWRADALRVNGFDTRMVGWGGEDIDFTARMLALGLERRRLKFGGAVFHLHHASQSRERSAANHALHDETVRSGRSWTPFGIVPADAPGGDR